nr:DUF1482 family protein [Escherichia coli]
MVVSAIASTPHKESCLQARDEQKISGECLPVKKVSLYLNNETPAG